jgi:hypothetical protein
MKLRIAFLMALVGLQLCYGQMPSKDGWISLFNGKDFTGWKVSGNVPSFKVVDGALVANGPVAHAFCDGPFLDHDF